MNIRKYLIALTVLMLALLPAACGAQEEPSGDLPELVIGSDDYRPYNYLDENGQAAGVDVALATEACRRMGYEPVFRQISWDEKDLLLEIGQVDCLWGCFSMNGRENAYLWAGPYLYSDQVVAVQRYLHPGRSGGPPRGGADQLQGREHPLRPCRCPHPPAPRPVLSGGYGSGGHRPAQILCGCLRQPR